MIVNSRKVFIAVIILCVLCFSIFKKKYIIEEFGFGISKALSKVASKSLKSLETAVSQTNNVSKNDDSIKKLEERVKSLESRMSESNNESEISMIKSKQDKQDDRINTLITEIMNIQKMFI